MTRELPPYNPLSPRWGRVVAALFASEPDHAARAFARAQTEHMRHWEPNHHIEYLEALESLLLDDEQSPAGGADGAA